MNLLDGSGWIEVDKVLDHGHVGGFDSRVDRDRGRRIVLGLLGSDSGCHFGVEVGDGGRGGRGGTVDDILQGGESLVGGVGGGRHRCVVPRLGDGEASTLCPSSEGANLKLKFAGSL